MKTGEQTRFVHLRQGFQDRARTLRAAAAFTIQLRIAMDASIQVDHHERERERVGMRVRQCRDLRDQGMPAATSQVIQRGDRPMGKEEFGTPVNSYLTFSQPGRARCLTW